MVNILHEPARKIKNQNTQGTRTPTSLDGLGGNEYSRGWINYWLQLAPHSRCRVAAALSGTPGSCDNTWSPKPPYSRVHRLLSSNNTQNLVLSRVLWYVCGKHSLAEFASDQTLECLYIFSLLVLQQSSLTRFSQPCYLGTSMCVGVLFHNKETSAKAFLDLAPWGCWKALRGKDSCWWW